MNARDKFVGIEAAFWDCEGAEVLTFVDPISALELCVENHQERERPTEEIIREMGTITVSAYQHRKHEFSDIEDAIDQALDAATEALDDEEHGDPDGDHAMFSLDVLARHRPLFETAVRALVAEARLWQCAVSATVDLSPEETIEILLTERPEWFGAEAAPASALQPLALTEDRTPEQLAADGDAIAPTERAPQCTGMPDCPRCDAPPEGPA